MSQNSSMCQHQKRGTLELDARRLGPTHPRRTAALDPLDRGAKIQQAPMNGSQVVFDPTGVLEVDWALGQLETVRHQQTLEGQLELAPKCPHRGYMNFGR